MPRNQSAFFSGSADNIVARVTGGAPSVIDGVLGSATSLWLVNPAGVAIASGASLDVRGSFHASSAHYVVLGNGEGRFYSSIGAASSLVSAPPSAFGFLGPAAAVSMSGAFLLPPAGGSLSLSLVGGTVTLDASRVETAGGDLVLAASGGGANEFSLSSRAWSSPPPTTGAIVMTDSIVRATDFVGAGGSIALRGGRARLVDSALASDNYSASLPGGSLSIEASGDVLLRRSVILSGSFSDGAAGAVRIAGSDVTVAGNSLVNTDSFAAGAGGDVSLIGRDILVSGGSTFSLRSITEGPGGNLLLQAGERITLEGNALLGTDAREAGPAGSMTLAARDILIRDAQIRSTSDGTGPGGRVSLQASGSILIESAGRINVDTKGPGQGGEVAISAGETFSLYGKIFSGAQRERRLGNAGSVSVSARDVVIGESGSISTATIGGGRAGDIRITASSVDISRSGDEASVESTTAGPGSGGSIFISAGRIVLHDGGRISASSSSAKGLAGTVAIEAAESLVLSGGSSIATEALAADGGDVTIRAGELVHLKDSRITTSVNTLTGQGGNITIDPTFVVLDSSEIIARAAQGAGGNINIVSDFFLGQSSVVDASSQTGISGVVAITSPKVDLNSSMVVLASNFLSLHRLSETCAARASRGSSSFIAAGRGGLASGDLVLPARPPFAAAALRSQQCPTPPA